VRIRLLIFAIMVSPLRRLDSKVAKFLALHTSLSASLQRNAASLLALALCLPPGSPWQKRTKAGVRLMEEGYSWLRSDDIHLQTGRAWGQSKRAWVMVSTRPHIAQNSVMFASPQAFLCGFVEWRPHCYHSMEFVCGYRPTFSGLLVVYFR